MDIVNLLSTIISSTAALVAIIGGFLVSRVISISSEQNAITRNLRDTNNQIKVKKEFFKDYEEYFLKDDIEDLGSQFMIKEILDSLDKNEDINVIYEEVIDIDDYYILSESEIPYYWKQLLDVIEEVFKALDGKNMPEDFKSFKANLESVQYEEKEYWYKNAFEVITEKFQRERAANSMFPMIYPTAPLVNNTNSDFAENKKAYEKLKNELRVLELQQTEQKKILNEFGRPSWVRSGIGVLIYASLVSIAFPSIFLALPLESYSISLIKWLCLGLFFSQLLVLFIYLTFAMYKLNHLSEYSIGAPKETINE